MRTLILCFLSSELTLRARRARTRELPGNYPFSVKAYYIFRFLEKWESPTFDCFEGAFKTFVEDLAKLVDEHFGVYVHGGLLSQIQCVTHDFSWTILPLTSAV